MEILKDKILRIRNTQINKSIGCYSNLIKVKYE